MSTDPVTDDWPSGCRARMTVLCDNSPALGCVSVAHGLCVLVQTPDRCVLFDTGPDETAVRNARALGAALGTVDAVVLSHGHYDHVGGLASVLRETGPLPVLAHPAQFAGAYVQEPSGEPRFIGPPLAVAEYQRLGARFEWSADSRSLGEHLTVTGEMAEPGNGGARSRAFLRRTETGLVPEDFRHEQALVVAGDGSATVLAGCAHAGAAALARHAGTAVNAPPEVLIGGLHLSSDDEATVRAVALDLHAAGVRRLLPCHCTGLQGIAALAASFPGKVVPVGVGSVICAFADGSIDVSNPVAV